MQCCPRRYLYMGCPKIKQMVMVMMMLNMLMLMVMMETN